VSRRGISGTGMRRSRPGDELGDVLDAAEANPAIASARGAIAVDGLVIVRGRIGQ
jgi:hypothetical protein